MSLSKERLIEIALEIANQKRHTFFCDEAVTDFALALIRRVEAELSFEYAPMHELLSQSNQLVTLPLVSEE